MKDNTTDPTYICRENVSIHVIKKLLRLFDSGPESTDPNDPSQKMKKDGVKVYVPIRIKD